MKSLTFKLGRGRGDALFHGAAVAAAALILLLMAGLFVDLVIGSRLSLSKFGLRFLWSNVWNPAT
ncbi:MAG: phosphate ABC transporter permease subunit PstC, partial [Nitrospiraceae bacterium]|nr:phosphate ABC transporter permease subunit PstC [Nitrospiraceae bacterium]